jgi:hypothetical protein
MTAKASKLVYTGLITKILLIMTILNVAGNISNVVIWLMSPSWNDPSLRDSLNEGLIASFAGTEGALVISSVIILVYATVYAITAFGLFRKSKWAPLLIIEISIVDRVLALVIFQLNVGFLIWSVWKIVMISLAFYLLRKK